jgi:ribosomal protein S10
MYFTRSVSINSRGYRKEIKNMKKSHLTFKNSKENFENRFFKRVFKENIDPKEKVITCLIESLYFWVSENKNNIERRNEFSEKIKRR